MPFQGDRIVVGRSSDCDIQLLGNEVSRRHAEFAVQGPIVTVRDLGSHNGTQLNRRAVLEVPLDNQDVIRLGDWVGIVTRCVPDAPFCEPQPGVIAGSEMARVLSLAQRVAKSELPVILTGETGTGKEVVARAVHSFSEREGEFVAVNCAALPESLAEAELFGHTKGAFTGANQARGGYFRAAERGTLLLDEIVDLAPSVQAKLLRVLQERQVTPLGTSHPIEVDVRILVAGQQPLAEAVRTGGFRADLYARLSGLELSLPPLRIRREEVFPMFTACLKQRLGGVLPHMDSELVESLCLYDWPNNVREVSQVAHQVAVLHGHESALTVAHLPATIATYESRSSNDHAELSSAPHRKQRSEQGREHHVARLLQELERHRGNVSKAAKAAGVSRGHAYRLLNSRPEFEPAKLRFRGDG